MKSYKDNRGVYHRTQAEAKASGFPFEMVDIPTSHAELIDFVNRLSVPPPPPTRPATEEEAQRGLNDIWPGDPVPAYTDPAQLPPYKNGDRTFTFMGSRNPEAIFMCVHCGRQNHNKAS